MLLSHRNVCSLLLAISALLIAQTASAIVSVGPGCQFDSIQKAINYVRFYEINHPDGVDPYIAVAGVDQSGNQAVYNESLTIDSSGIGGFYVFGTFFDHAFFQIYGDYDADCGKEIGSYAYIGASGTNSVLEISGGSVVQVVLNHLVMAGAPSGVKNGGGINFHGSGYLELSNLAITGNQAGYGAGIDADGQPPGISLILHGGTAIYDNHAANDGGGIRIANEVHLYMLENPTVVSYNTAGGSGGGLHVTGANAYADISTPGWNGDAVFHHNSAHDGGGVAVQDHGIARMFQTVPGAPPRIENNEATSRGGGVFVDAQNDGQTYGTFCAFGYGINSNTAQFGAAISAATSGDGSTGGRVLLRRDSQNVSACGTQPATDLGFIGCAGNAFCNSISGNAGFDDVLFASGQAALFLERVAIQGNRTSNFLASSVGLTSIRNCLISNNDIPYQLLGASSGGGLELDGCTIAGNVVSGTSPLMFLSTDSTLSVSATIISSTVPTLARGGGTLHVQDVIASETDSLTTNSVSSNVLQVSNPGFVDPAAGNYHLLSSSPAVDFAASSDLGIDLDGNPRGKDLPPVNGPGPFDIGAYELQTYTPCSASDRIFCNGFGP